MLVIKHKCRFNLQWGCMTVGLKDISKKRQDLKQILDRVFDRGTDEKRDVGEATSKILSQLQNREKSSCGRSREDFGQGQFPQFAQC